MYSKSLIPLFFGTPCRRTMTVRTTTRRTTTLTPATSKRTTTQPPSSTDSSCGRLQWRLHVDILTSICAKPHKFSFQS